ncbi:MAG: phosphate ABC transporter permease subunit PstC [candidate division Zixibacteria bacterium HGW-Zixibacteria-1]|nr:MAG: phosphate ABC transporter permease subunit PstC [candidate division Zixibacteria bacterium HGW-Zixibacteria-1]
MQELKFKPKSKLREFMGEKFIAVNAMAALIAILLIFVFIFKEAIPIFTDQEIKEEASLDKMTFKQEYYEGRAPKFSWQPNSDVPKYSLYPLFLGTIKTALIAMLFAVPLGVGAAIYSSEFASQRVRELIKPVIEMLAAIPSVVLGFFALLVLATFLQNVFGLTFRLNVLNAGIALGLAVIPIVFTVAEDAMTSVPRSLREAATALGANPWQVSLTMVFPAALPGIAAGVVLGFGRAIGETMIVLMASGNAAIISASFLESARTFSATIAAELAEVVFGSAHYSVLFFIGTLLFIFTFIINLSGEMVLTRVKERIQGKTR